MTRAARWYGAGRVTDDKDRRLLNTILENLYNNKTLTEEYKFTSSGLYYAKHVDTREEYEQLVAGLPILPLPEAFGLHENAGMCLPPPRLSTRNEPSSPLYFNSRVGGIPGSQTSPRIAMTRF